MRRRALALLVTTSLMTVGLAAAPPALAAAPTITSFSPTSGPASTNVAIVGTNFAAPATVKFAGAASTTVVVASATRINARVPAGTTTGRISVTDAGGTATSTTNFTVTPGASTSPAAGPPTTTATFSFSGFGASEAVDVYVDTTDVALVSTSQSGIGQVSVTIPASAQPGTHWITAVGRHSGSSAQAAFLVRSSWSQPANTPTNTAYNRYENTLNTGNVSQLDEDWQVNDCTDCLISTPVVANGIVFEHISYLNGGAVADGSLVARNETTGALLWSAELSVGSFVPAALSNPLVFAVSGSTVNAYNQTTGALAWQKTLNGRIYHLVAAAGVLYATTAGAVYALVATTGKQSWEAGCTRSGESSPSAPAISGSFVLYTCYGSSDATIAELQIVGNQPQLAWSTLIPGYHGQIETVTTDATVEVSGGLALTETSITQEPGAPMGGGFAAFKVSSGSLVWNVQLSNAAISDPALANAALYYTTDAASTGAAPIDTGTPTWTDDVGAENDTPALANGLLFVSDDQITRVLRASDGVQLASLPVSEGSYAAPVVVDGAVFLVDGSGSVDGSSILERWTLNGDATPAAVHRPHPASLRPDRSLQLR